MSGQDELGGSIELIRQLLNLVEANQEIAVMRIAQLREAVLQTRSLAQGLADVYTEVRTSHVQEMAEEERRQHRSGSALVLLSTNERLAGPITAITARHFIEQASTTADDIVIVGRIGQERFQAAFPNRSVIGFDIPQQDVALEQLAPLLKQLLRYQRLTLVYPTFENVISQKPAVQEIGTTFSEELAQRTRPKQPTVSRYIFEPSLAEVVKFFDRELFGLVMRQFFSELDLAMVGSRITSLETASTTIAQEVESLEHQRRVKRRERRNQKQRERLAGRRLWAV